MSAPEQSNNTELGSAVQGTVIPRRAPSRAKLWQLRGLIPGIGVLVLVGVAFAQQVLILDADPAAPQFRGIHEANAAIWPMLIAVAAGWVASFLPYLTRFARLLLLFACLCLVVIAGPAWLVWVLAR